MEDNRYIVAIDLGTSKIVGAVGYKNSEGLLTVSAIEREDSAGCVKRGCIINVEEAASRVKRIITKLENRIGGRIAKVYVGLGGQSLHSVDQLVSRHYTEETSITDDLIASMMTEASTIPLYNAEVVKAIPTEFMINNNLEVHPQGIYGSDIATTTKLLIARPSLKKNIHRCLTERLKLPIADFIPSPLATAAATLSQEEKNLGCALVDFGGGTTTVTIYKDDFLRYAVTIPFGGRNITRDICSLNVLDSDAERLKLAFGSAIAQPETKQKQHINLDGIDVNKIKFNILSRIVESRIEEIVENVLAQIEESSYSKQLSAGIVITGGASQLKGLVELIKPKTTREVNKGFMQKNISFLNKEEANFNPANVQVIGLLLLGNDHCLAPREVPIESSSEQEVRIPPKRTDESNNTPRKNKMGSIFGGLKDRMGKLFEEDDTELN